MKHNIRKALASATCVLLASSSAHAENSLSIGAWDISSAFLFYRESDRVQAVEPIVSARKFIDTDEFVSIKLTVDSLTGASGNGAVPSTEVQTFTRPSGNGSYSTPSGDTPLDDTFKDGRVALSGSWNRPSFWGTQSELSLSVSNEYDYRSIATSVTFAKNVNNANTTLSTGVSLASDTIEPVGGAPVPFATMEPKNETAFRDSGSTDKTLVDVIAGVTQIIDINSLFQFNYSLSFADGYLNDPYKVISVVDSVTGNPVFENAAEPALPTVIYENRPNTRTKHSLFGQYKRYLQGNGDVLDSSYRFMRDDWGINSHTIDFKYRKRLSKRKFLQPHIRLYYQQAADFYTPYLSPGSVPDSGDQAQYASADYRLGEFTAYTIGLEYGQTNLDSSWSVTLEYYLQTGDEPGEKFGALTGLELYPDVDAVMFRILYDF